MSTNAGVEEKKRTSAQIQVLIRVRPTTTKEKDAVHVAQQQQSTSGMLTTTTLLQQQQQHPQQPPLEMFEFDRDNDQILLLRDPENSSKPMREFKFDKAFTQAATQEDVFNMCKPLVNHVLSGYNSCFFAYGQTGSGKTYSTFGEHGALTGPARGLAPRTVEYLFQMLEPRKQAHDVSVYVSFLEIYLGNIIDLGKSYIDEHPSVVAEMAKTNPSLSSFAGSNNNNNSSGNLSRRSWSSHQSGSKESLLTSSTSSASQFQSISSVTAPSTPSMSRTRSISMSSSLMSPGTPSVQVPSLDVRESQNGEVFVKDLTMIPVSQPEQVMEIIQSAVKKRATFETNMNEYSSRSHMIMTITVFQTDKRLAGNPGATRGHTIVGKLNFVDLAGSERLKKSESEGLRLKEALDINQSLSCLGNVILGINRGDPHIPYRDSKLTRILQDSLGGNSFTTLLATLNPLSVNYEECLSTLQFANRCKNIVNQPRINYIELGSDDSKDRKIAKLQAEVESLRFEISNVHKEYSKKMSDVNNQLQKISYVYRSANNGKSVPGVSEMLNMFNTLTPLGNAGISTNNGNTNSGGIHTTGGSSNFSDGGTAIARSINSNTGSDPNSSNNNGSPAKNNNYDMMAMFQSVMAMIDGSAEGGPGWDNTEAGNNAAANMLSIEEMQKTVDMLTRQRDALVSKLEKKKQAVQSIQKSFADTKGKHNDKLQEYKDKFAKMTRELTENKRELLNSMKSREEHHNNQIRTLISNSEMILEDMNNLIRSFPQELRVASQQLRDQEKVAEEAKRATEEHYKQLMKKLDESKDASLAQMKRMYESLIKNKDDQIKRLQSEFDEFKKQAKLENTRMREELLHLFEYTEKLNMIITKLETGEYPVHVRFGIKCVRLYDQDKPKPLLMDLLPHLKKILQRTNKFIESAEQQAHNKNIGDEGDFYGSSNFPSTSYPPSHRPASASSRSIGRVSRPSSAAKPLSAPVTSRSVTPVRCQGQVITTGDAIYTGNRMFYTRNSNAAGSNDEVSAVMSAPTTARAGAPIHKQFQHCQLPPQHQQQLEMQENTVMNAVATTGGEDEAARYRKLYQDQLKSTNQLRVAHEALKREMERLKQQMQQNQQSSTQLKKPR